MFVRDKRIGPYTYVYLVETVREDGRVKQRILRNLGRTEEVDRRGDLDRLARSAARLAQRSLLLSALDEGTAPQLACRRIGPPLLFERLWRDTGCGVVLHELLRGRGFGFAAERAVFLTVLHRLMVSGSDRACEQWREDYRLEGVGALQLHHLYRAMTGPHRTRSMGPALAWGGIAGRGADRPHAGTPQHQGPRRGTAVRPPARPVQRSVGRVHGHHLAVFRGRRRC